MNQKQLSKKAYAKWDRGFMLAGSLLNGSQGYLAQSQNLKEDIEKLVNLAFKMTDERIEQLYQEEDNQEDTPL